MILRTRKSGSAWNPRALHWTTLLAFATAFAMLLATVIALFEISRVNDGLTVSTSSHHYAWTYGPMALVVLIAGAWHQVDYQCRLLAPWKSLATGPKPAASTLLLDYMSPMAPVTCFKSVRNKHWAPAASSAAGMLLDLVLVFSTAFLVLAPVQKSVSANSIPVMTSFSTQNMVNYSGDSAAGMSYWATIDRGLGLPYGSTPSGAFSVIDLSSESLRNEILEVLVPAFVPELRCEAASVNFTISHRAGYGDTDTPALDADLIFDLSLSTPECQTSTWYLNGPDMLTETVSPRVLIGSMGDADLCENLSNGYVYPWTFTVLDMRYTQIFGPSQNQILNVTSWNAELVNATGVLCYPSYAIRPAMKRTDIATGKLLSLVIDDNAESSRIEGLNDTQLSGNLSLAIDALYQVLPAKWSPLDLTEQQNDDAGFTLMSLLRPGATLEQLLDPTELTTAAQTVFKGFAAQFAHIELSVAKSGSASGSREFSELRIVVKEIPMIVLSICFGLLAFLAIIVLLFRPKDVIIRSPRSLLSNAAFMSHSPAVKQRLKHTGQLSDTELKLTLLGSSYRSTVEESEKLVIEETTLVHNSGFAPKKSDSLCWWCPIPSRLYFILLLAAVVCGLIAGLQLIDHLSKPNRGFLYLTTEATVAGKWSSLVPTAIMVITKLAVQSSGSALLLFTTFAALKRARISAWRALMLDAFGQLPTVNIVRAFRYQQLSVAVLSFALLLSSFLTITVSGVYTVENCAAMTNNTVTPLDYFDYDWNTTANSTSPDNYAGLNFALLNLRNLSYPAWTFDELVFPRFDESNLTDSLPGNLSDGNARVQMHVPAVRASLNCTFAILGRASSVWVKDAPGPPNELNFVQSNQIYVPEECSGTSDPQVANTTTIIPAIILRDGGQYYSIQNEYPWPPYNKSNMAAYPGKCPNFGFTYGFTSPHSNSSDNITSITCYQQIQQVNTLSTFVLPDWTIDAASPPVVKEDTVRTIVEYADYDLETIISDNLGDLTYAPLDPFFINAINGSEGVPEAEMLGLQGQAKLLTTVQHTYRKYMAQAVPLNMRKNMKTSSESAPIPAYTASLINSNRLCLVQNWTPKLVLQILLGTILLCLFVGYILTPMRKILQHNPLTIAGAMSLVAEGHLAQNISEGGMLPDDAQAMSDKDLISLLKGDAGDGISLRRPRSGWWSADGKPIVPARIKVLEGKSKSTPVVDAERDNLWYGVGLVADSTGHGDHDEIE